MLISYVIATVRRALAYVQKRLVRRLDSINKLLCLTRLYTNSKLPHFETVCGGNKTFWTRFLAYNNKHVI